MKDKGEGKGGEWALYICACILTPRSFFRKEGTGTVHSGKSVLLLCFHTLCIRYSYARIRSHTLWIRYSYACIRYAMYAYGDKRFPDRPS